MRSTRVLLTIPLLLAASVASALGAEVRDKAGLFSPEAVKKANAELSRIERETNVPVTIETIGSLNGRSIDDALTQLGKSEGIRGLFVVIAAKDHKSEAGASLEYDPYFNRPLYQDIRDSFSPSFRKGDFDGGLASGLAKIESTLASIKAEAGGTITPKAARPAVAVQPTRRGAAPAPRNPVPGKASGMGTLLWIVVGIVVVMVVIRLIGGLVGAGRGGAYGPGGMQGGPGGYGGGSGYGGRGGGFMSSLFGGIGGAMAGNWLYDQFSGRNHHGDGGYMPPSQEGAPPAETGGDWGGTAGDGGGSWGGGGGGGDWGGGGGGGGGDWGGGGGGGDWGGGGGDGGSW